VDVWYDLIGLGSRNASVIRASYVPVCLMYRRLQEVVCCRSTLNLLL
jgi:hypothetical protein